MVRRTEEGKGRPKQKLTSAQNVVRNMQGGLRQIQAVIRDIHKKGMITTDQLELMNLPLAEADQQFTNFIGGNQ